MDPWVVWLIAAVIFAVGEIATLRIDGDADRLAAWLGAPGLPVTVHPGPPAVAGIALTGDAGEFVLETES